MGLEVLIPGTLLLIGAFGLFLMLLVDVHTESNMSFAAYYRNHSKLFQFFFYLLFIAFPINFGLGLLPRIPTFSQKRIGEIITFTFLLWPMFMYIVHRGFQSISRDLGIPSWPDIEIGSKTKAGIYVTGWIGSLTAIFLLFYIILNDIDSILETPMFFIGLFGIGFIPLRKSIATVRGTDKLKVLILDLDGVIRHIDLDTAEKAAQSIGFDYDELMDTLWDNEYSHELLCGRYDRETWWDHVSLFDDRLQGVSQDVLWDEVFEKSTYDIELIEYVRGLKDSLILVILTNCDIESKIKILEDLGDGHPFDNVISSSDLGIKKPNPDVFRTVLESFDVKPEQVLFFDDSVDNVNGAEQVGIKAYLFRGFREFRIRIEDALNQDT